MDSVKMLQEVGDQVAKVKGLLILGISSKHALEASIVKLKSIWARYDEMYFEPVYYDNRADEDKRIRDENIDLYDSVIDDAEESLEKMIESLETEIEADIDESKPEQQATGHEQSAGEHGQEAHDGENKVGAAVTEATKKGAVRALEGKEAAAAKKAEETAAKKAAAEATEAKKACLKREEATTGKETNAKERSEGALVEQEDSLNDIKKDNKRFRSGKESKREEVKSPDIKERACREDENVSCKEEGNNSEKEINPSTKPLESVDGSSSRSEKIKNAAPNERERIGNSGTFWETRSQDMGEQKILGLRQSRASTARCAPRLTRIRAIAQFDWSRPRASGSPTTTARLTLRARRAKSARKFWNIRTGARMARGLQRKPRSKPNLKFMDRQSHQGSQRIRTNLKLRSYAMANEDKEATNEAIKSRREAEADIDQRRRKENEANTWEIFESEARRPSLQAVHGSPPKVLSGDEANEEKRYHDAIKKAATARKRQDSKLAKFGATLDQHQEKVNSRAARTARSHHLPRKTSEIAADLTYKSPPATATATSPATAEKFPPGSGVFPTGTRPSPPSPESSMSPNSPKTSSPVVIISRLTSPAQPSPDRSSPAAETEPLPKPHQEEIPTARPKISTKHFTERVWERSPPFSPPRDTEHYHSDMYPSPTTTPESPDADVITMEGEEAQA